METRLKKHSNRVSPAILMILAIIRKLILRNRDDHSDQMCAAIWAILEIVTKANEHMETSLDY